MAKPEHEKALNSAIFPQTQGGPLMHVIAAKACLLYTSPSPRDRTRSRMPSSACKKKIKRKHQPLQCVQD